MEKSRPTLLPLKNKLAKRPDQNATHVIFYTPLFNQARLLYFLSVAYLYLFNFKIRKIKSALVAKIQLHAIGFDWLKKIAYT